MSGPDHATAGGSGGKIALPELGTGLSMARIFLGIPDAPTAT